MARQVAAWRRREKLSQSQAAVQIGVNLNTLQNWEQGRNEPRGLARAALRQIISPSAEKNAAQPRLTPGAARKRVTCKIPQINR